MIKEDKEKYMRLALNQAEIAQNNDEVPVGAVIVLDGQVIAQGYNLQEGTNDVTRHAEIEAIRQANQKLENWRLTGAQIFITVEPCLMCSGAILLSRISQVYFGAFNAKGGCAGNNINLFQQNFFNHHSDVEGGILAADCARLMSNFFQKKRGNNS
jgi:tRNA(adenine34) deaminase